MFEACPSTAIIMKRFATDSGRPVGLTARRGGRTVYGPGGEPFNEEMYQNFKRFHAEEVAKYM